jgi:hypothetical protein
MSKAVHEISMLNMISVRFSKLAGKSKYQGKRRTNEQWSTLLWAYYRDVLSPSIKQMIWMAKLLMRLSIKIN